MPTNWVLYIHIGFPSFAKIDIGFDFDFHDFHYCIKTILKSVSTVIGYVGT